LSFALKALSSGTQTFVPYSVRKPIAWNRILLIASVLLVSALIAVSIYFRLSRRNPIHSIAILPFTNGSSDAKAEYLSDGITESIIHGLSSLPQLRVMARDTVFTYKGQSVDPRKVGHDLNVEAVVTGRVVQEGDTLIIRADMVNVSDGTEVWGNQYDRKLSDVLSIQEEIAREISKNLQFKLTGQDEQRVVKHYTENPEAYQLYLRGQYHWFNGSQGFNTAEDFEKSIEFYNKAIEKDRKYALPYAGIANAYAAMAFAGYTQPKEAARKAKEAVTKALELDDSLGETRWSHANVLIDLEWDFVNGEKEYHRSFSLNPNFAPARRFYSTFLRAMGRFEEAITQAKKALELDPLSAETNKGLGATYFWAGQYDDAIAQYLKTVDLDPRIPDTYDFLSDAYARKGMYKEALAKEQKFLRLLGDEEGATILGKDFESYGYQKAKQRQLQAALNSYLDAAKEEYVSPILVAAMYAQLDKKDEAFEWIEKALEERSPWLIQIKTDPQFENLRSDPRFSEILRRVGLPQ
jgi:TolB-like protein/Tfp pilus assembly protein PilF